MWSAFTSIRPAKHWYCVWMRSHKSSPGSNPTGTADEKGAMWNHDARLQTQRNHLPVCRAQCAGRNGDWSCYPRHRNKEFLKFLRQIDRETPPELDLHWSWTLWNSQSRKCPPVAGKASALSSSFYPDQFLMAESGGALVWGDYTQTNPARRVQKCAGVD